MNWYEPASSTTARLTLILRISASQKQVLLWLWNSVTEGRLGEKSLTQGPNQCHQLGFLAGLSDPLTISPRADVFCFSVVTVWAERGYFLLILGVPSKLSSLQWGCCQLFLAQLITPLLGCSKPSKYVSTTWLSSSDTIHICTAIPHASISEGWVSMKYSPWVLIRWEMIK